MEDGEERKQKETLDSEKEAIGIQVKVIQPFKPSVRMVRTVAHGKCYYHPAKPASFICASCSKSICTVCARDVSGVNFCPQCAPVPEPVPPPTQPAPAPSVNMFRALFTIGVILIVIGAILLVAYWPLSTINAAKFQNIQEEYWAEGGHNFKNLREGDVILIRDTISRMSVEHDDSWGVVTLLWFKSTGVDDTDFSMRFDADLERDYHVGDGVVITLHIGIDPTTQNEVIREFRNNLPNMSNIDHSFSVDLIFISIMILGAACMAIYFIATRKLKKLTKETSNEPKDSRDMSKKGSKDMFQSDMHDGERQ